MNSEQGSANVTALARIDESTHLSYIVTGGEIELVAGGTGGLNVLFNREGAERYVNLVTEAIAELWES